MSSYKISEPSALKFLKANGAVVDENGNVVSDASDYWKKVYDQAEPKVAKYLHADGTIDENPGSGGGGSDLEDNKKVSITENGTIEITPTEGKDGMKKVTATVNVSGGKEYYLYKYRVICEASTFDEISLGMKAIIVTNSSEGQMIYASCVSIENDTAIFEDNDGYYSVDIEKSEDVVPFSTIFG